MKKRRNIKLVLLMQLVLLLVVFGFLWLCLLGSDFSGLIRFCDSITAISMLLFVIPGMMILGEGKYFCKALSVGQKKYSLRELKNTLEAVKTCQRLVVLSGLLEIIILMVGLLTTLPEDNFWIVGFQFLAILTPGFYMIIAEYFLLPLSINTQKAINEEMELDEED